MKTDTGTRKNAVPAASVNLDSLLDKLRELILQARQQALRAVDVVQVRTCWEMGRHIVEFEKSRAEQALIEAAVTGKTDVFGEVV